MYWQTMATVVIAIISLMLLLRIIMVGLHKSYQKGRRDGRDQLSKEIEKDVHIFMINQENQTNQKVNLEILKNKLMNTMNEDSVSKN